MICGLLEDLFNGLALHLEIAVKACLVETQDHHVIGLLRADFQSGKIYPCTSIYIFSFARVLPSARNRGVTGSHHCAGLCGHPRESAVSADDKNVMQGTLRLFQRAEPL
jgi:hypothetical protein